MQYITSIICIWCYFFPSSLPGTAAMENKHISTWHYEPLNCPLSLVPCLTPSLSSCFQLHTHPVLSWGPLAAVPIIHPKTQHPHQALANLCSTAKTQRENERSEGMARGQNAFSASLRAPDQEPGRRAHLNERERQTKRERC